jgi:hypothetical protein
MPFMKAVTKSPGYAQSSPDRWQYHHVWEFNGDRRNRLLWIAEIENQDIMKARYLFWFYPHADQLLVLSLAPTVCLTPHHDS